MRRPVVALLCLLVYFVAPTASVNAGQTASGNPKAAGVANFKIEPIKTLRKGVDAWPLIVNPGTPAELLVNSTLTQLNLRLALALRDCDVGALESLKLMGEQAGPRGSVSEDWSRKVQVTMTGPRFLSIVATDETFCGGAHPDADRNALVFDMTTGALVEWSALVAKPSGAASEAGSGLDGTTSIRLVFPALEKINASRADAESKDAFWLPQSFLIWPDAQKGSLIVQEADLPHVVQSCAIEIALTIDEARKLGFDESLLNAIEQAHRRFVSKPKL